MWRPWRPCRIGGHNVLYCNGWQCYVGVNYAICDFCLLTSRAAVWYAIVSATKWKSCAGNPQPNHCYLEIFAVLKCGREYAKCVVRSFVWLLLEALPLGREDARHERVGRNLGGP